MNILKQIYNLLKIRSTIDYEFSSIDDSLRVYVHYAYNVKYKRYLLLGDVVRKFHIVGIGVNQVCHYRITNKGLNLVYGWNYEDDPSCHKEINLLIDLFDDWYLKARLIQ